jgi:alpha-beta hydrolase superfamily lysophospholipase
MEYTTTSFPSAADSLAITTHRWEAGSATPLGVVQIAHGVAEHSKRYDRLAQALSSAGYIVYASDHRGHGESVGGDVVLGGFGAAGWDALVDDLSDFGTRIRDDNPDLPLFLVAHSMGSFAAQQAILTHSDLWRGVVLSGSTALDILVEALATAPSDGPVGLTAFNEGFENRTGYEWLSRDEEEVDKYVADTLSGFDLPDETLPLLFSQAGRLADPAELAGIRKDLPILIISGQDDPVSGGGQLVSALASRYTETGLTDVTLQVYPGARHEIFNETNRDEITEYVIDWIKAHG